MNDADPCRPGDPEPDPVAALCHPEAIRERAGELLAAAEQDALAHFELHPRRLPATARYVAHLIRRDYPALAVPFHSRWRHFVVDGEDRWEALSARHARTDADERARARIDLAVTSVLLDAGAGPAWRYRDGATGRHIGRSEGLAVASLDAFAAGLFATDPDAPLRADGAALARVTPHALAGAFQVDDENPLVGLDGRAGLLRRLGEAVLARPDLFGNAPPRPGGLYDHLRAQATDGRLPARVILAAVLEGLGSIWPGRITLAGRNLGDVWRHRAVRRADATDGLVPLHKLSQWLSYSLIEPLEEAGVQVTSLDDLTGLAEYRNGGLLVDLGVLSLRDARAQEIAHDPGAELIVEWRALTVALLDRLAPLVREALGVSAEAFPMAKVLQGGTWSAGREAAAERRPDGGPPIRIASDGTVF